MCPAGSSHGSDGGGTRPLPPLPLWEGAASRVHCRIPVVEIFKIMRRHLSESGGFLVSGTNGTGLRESLPLRRRQGVTGSGAEAILAVLTHFAGPGDRL